MKIKTITCHKVYNYGATLQEYALLKYLIDLGHEVETINYTPDYLKHTFNLFEGSSNPKYNKNPLINTAYMFAKLPQRVLTLKRKRSFDLFEEKHVASTSENFTSNIELKDNIPEADAYICGSDQIWNSFFQNGKDPAFYLDFVPDNKIKISYAASFAIDEIEEELKPFVKEKVERINNISVRESSGLKILNKLGIENAVQVLDPVFLIDKEVWQSKFITPINEKYIFVYDSDSNEQIKNISEHVAKKLGLKIFTVNPNIKYADENFFTKGPEIFLSLINSATYVIGNSFHAVAFSLIFEKNFLVLDRNERINTRMRDIMNSLGLSDFHLAIDEFMKISEVDIDYSMVNIILQNRIEESKKFLINSITKNI